jgi:hypothetical protein
MSLRGGNVKKRVACAVVALILSGCGGDSGTGDDATTAAATTQATTTTTTAAATTTTAAPTTTTAAAPTTTEAAAAGVVPDPTSGATLVPGSPENITAGDVFVYWYRDSVAGNYVVLYTGPGIAGAEGLGLCPGNSIAAPGFMHISNTPVEDGSCDGFPTETASVQVCSGDVWIYRTAIPGDLEGTLFGSLEWTSTDGSIKGLTSQFPTSPDLPTLEYGLASYSLWEGFTSDGSSTITCSAPTT